MYTIHSDDFLDGDDDDDEMWFVCFCNSEVVGEFKVSIGSLTGGQERQ